MRVAYLTNQYPSVSHTFIRREIEAMEALGVQVTRYSVRRSRSGFVDAADEREAGHTRVILEGGVLLAVLAAMQTLLLAPLRFVRAMNLAVRVGLKSDRGLLYHMFYFAEACILCRWIASTPVDHIHVHFGTNPTTVAMLCSELSGTPFSFTVHGPEEFDRAPGLGLADKVARSAFVAVVSSFGRSQLMRWCDPAHWHKIAVIRCGVDASYTTRTATPVSSSRRLVCVGRLCEQKGQLLLIEAAAKLRDDGCDCEIVLAGDGPFRELIESKIDVHGLSDSVRITGWVTGAVVHQEIEQSRAMVLPSFAEGLPVVIMEALALERPVISTYVAGIPELVEPSVNGWLTPAGSVDQLAHAMRCALDASVDCLAKMGQAGRNKVLAKHSTARETARLLELINRSAKQEAGSATQAQESRMRDPEPVMARDRMPQP